VRRVRMTTRRSGGRDAITHYVVRQRIDSAFGEFTLLEVKIDTGRTHQIRVHLSSLGHPVAGDVLYGAPGQLQARLAKSAKPGPRNDFPSLHLHRNFLHAAALELHHPRTGQALSFKASLPPELESFLAKLQSK
jgi:23S rRNA pseudouridine1911/1915/1917 synthase